MGRAELVLARDDRLPLRDVPLDPDPLSGMARALGLVRTEMGERAEVVVDLLPLTAGDRRRRRRAAVAAERRRAEGGSNWRAEVAAGLGLGGGGQASPSPGWARASRPGPLEVAEDRAEARAASAKVFGHDPAFWCQLLIRAESPVLWREAALVQAVVAAFEIWAGENYLRVAGVRLGPLFWGADSVLWRRRFDRRWDTGLHTRRQLVTATELAGLLKPPTASCTAENVARSVGAIPAPPPGLPTYTEDRRDLLPLGWVAIDGAERPVGVPLADSLFTFNCGRTGAGKTEAALARAAALFRAGHGGLYVDPHNDAVARLKALLGDRDGVVDVDLAGGSVTAHPVGWNPFARQGESWREVGAKVSAIVAAFGVAMRWSELNTRAVNLTTQATRALCELASRLPEELAPTIFQLTTLLSDDDWRRDALPHLSAPTRDFFERRFARLTPDAITAVTNVVDRMRASVPLAVLFGQSRSTYDIRAAMDSGQVVLWSLGGGGDLVDLLTCFVTYDLFRAAMSRAELPPAARRPFYAFIDEAQTITGGSAGAAASVVRALRETRKMGLRYFLLSQEPAGLGEALEPVLNNRSHLLSHVVGHRAAALLAREWGRAVTPETIGRLPRHHFLAQVTFRGQTSTPFLCRGFDLRTDEPWASWWDQPDTASAAAPAGVGNEPPPSVRTILDHLATLDRRIAAHLADQPPPDAGPPAPYDEVPPASS